jgi:hypothetical protein
VKVIGKDSGQDEMCEGNLDDSQFSFRMVGQSRSTSLAYARPRVTQGVARIEGGSPFPNECLAAARSDTKCRMSVSCESSTQVLNRDVKWVIRWR